MPCPSQPTAPGGAPPSPDGELLATMRADGSRKWLRPKPSHGKFWVKRAWVAWGLMALFTITPWIRINGSPLFLFDVTARRFIVFGTTFHADETLPLALLVVSFVLGIFLITSLLGRAWCGWACPQTVYLEFLYRPIERWIEGKHYKNAARFPLPKWRLVAKYVIFGVLSLHLANTFLSWFVGTDRLVEWTRQSPFEHPVPFLVVFITTAAMMFDFAFWREQMCTLACPYARLQSVLLDRSSLVVGYDPGRGEPRGNTRKLEAQGVIAGDCVDCHRCVTTCPTGIDIRDGLQLECVACTQCIDACDDVMESVGRPKGLIRYASEAELAGEKVKRLRPRVVIYPILLLATLSLLGASLAARTPAQLDLLRSRGHNPFRTLENGNISSLVHVHVTNRTDEEGNYDLQLVGPGELLKPGFPISVEGQTAKDGYVHVILPKVEFVDGRSSIKIELLQDGKVLDSAERDITGPLGGSPR